MKFGMFVVSSFLSFGFSIVAIADVDEATQLRAKQGFAAEMYGVVSNSLSAALAEKDLSSEDQGKVIFAATSYVSECVIADLVERPLPKSDQFIQTLANLPDDASVLETLKLRYGDAEAETLWLNVELILERCLGRAHELLGLTEE